MLPNQCIRLIQYQTSFFSIKQVLMCEQSLVSFITTSAPQKCDSLRLSFNRVLAVIGARGLTRQQDFLSNYSLTDGICCHRRFGQQTWFAHSSGIDGSDSVFILQALDQICRPVSGHGDGILVGTHPSVRPDFFTLDNVSRNLKATVFFWRVPGHGHAVTRNIKDGWTTRRSRHIYGGG